MYLTDMNIFLKITTNKTRKQIEEHYREQNYKYSKDLDQKSIRDNGTKENML